MVLHKSNSLRCRSWLNSRVLCSSFFFLMPTSTVYNGKLQSVFLVRSMYIDSSHLCRGDTISSHLSVINLHFKLDFRLIAKNFNNDKFDVTTGELARHSSTTSSKMNGDFIKSSLTTIVHLNAPLKRMSYIPPK